MHKLSCLLLVLLLSCGAGGAPAFRTAGGPQDVAGFNQYLLGMPFSAVDSSGMQPGTFNDEDILKGSLQLRIGDQDCTAGLTLSSYTGATLDQVSVSIDNPAPDLPRSLRIFKLLSASIRHEYDRGWYKSRVSEQLTRDINDADGDKNKQEVMWQNLLLSDSSRDGITLQATEDGVSMLFTRDAPRRPRGERAAGG